MAERIDLTAPITSTLWRIRSLVLERGLSSNGGPVTLDASKSMIQVTLIGENGRTLTHTWNGAGADTDIVALNKLNLTTNTLNKRILDKLIADGVIVGASTGTPD